MRRLAVLVLVVAAAGMGVVAPTAVVPKADAGAPPGRTLVVTGTGVDTYPAFDPTISRYAATTTADTGGALTITATPAGSGSVYVDGLDTWGGPRTVTGLSPGDEVSVIFDDSDGRSAYSVMYLPEGFPKLTVTTDVRADEQPGLVAITPNAFNVLASQPSYNAIIDRNGVPVYAIASGAGDFDLKQQPNGEITVFRKTTTPGRTGSALVTLTDQLADGKRREVASPLTNTDNHDSVRLADGSGTILLGYEPNSVTHKTDSVIEKIDPKGDELFRWTSAGLESETLMPASADYAHINSVVSVENGDVIASFRHFSAVFRIATVAHDGYSKGQIIWKLGGRDSSFTFPDDPYGGPCGQHTASELPNGHILVFDNGTSSLGSAPSLCVDPANRATGTVDRNFTRVAEYALDLDAGRASLVWSYPADQSRYTYFAGSARRLANGNTLIGWAVDTHALATEVEPDGTKVWEVTTPAPPSDPPNLRHYATYRAELIPDVPDRIPPAIDAGADTNPVYRQGDVAFAGTVECSDRGGSNLQTCSGGGPLMENRLDTSTLGVHTWGATATDGAGNRTTVVRRYTVRAWIQQPDALIRKAGSSTWKGDHVYGPATDQTVRQSVRRTRTAGSQLVVQNDGERPDTFAVSGTPGSARWRVRYFQGTEDVTDLVVHGAYELSLQPGQQAALRIKVMPTARARVGGVHTFTLRAWSTTDATAVDHVATRVTALR